MTETLTQTVVNDLTQYDGPWGPEQAAHLLRRTSYGLLQSEIDQLVELGMDAAVDILLEDKPLPPPPINYNFENDPNVAIGETWVGQTLEEDDGVLNYRRQSFRPWMIDTARKERMSIREQMVLFWINHFGITGVNIPQVRYEYHTTLQTFALGNFRELIKAVTINPAMLVFLNGNQNNANSPNENYARELLELFTVGKGPQIGPGDYSNYTEDDVRAIARALTGWRTRYFNSTEFLPESYYQANRHDTGDKQLSYHFNNDIITNADDQEYAVVVDRIFQQPACAYFICRKLYRHFVYYEITEEEEVNIIGPMAQMLIAADYEIRPVMSALLKSKHFYDLENRGPMIKNPLQLVIGMLRTFDYQHLSPTLNQERLILQTYYGRARNMEMDYFNLPSVAGWEAYYQAPAFYRIWINSSTLQERIRFTNQVTNNGFNLNGLRFRFDYLGFIENIPDATDPNALILALSKLLVPRPLTDTQLANLKEALIPGLPDFEWTVEYGMYLSEPSPELEAAVEDKLKDLFRAFFNLAEFQLV
ncbi:MAG: DUF1800 domain-containing protein [Bacteroidota bacterium]